MIDAISFLLGWLCAILLFSISLLLVMLLNK